MQPNPYESPRPGEPDGEKPPVASDPIVQLLMEIRDCQRESLELARAAHMRQRGVMRYMLPLIVLVPLITFWFMRYLTATRMPLPTPVPRTVIVPMPPPGR